MALPSEKKLLTARRLEILKLVANGYTNAEIAAELWLGVETVKTHLMLLRKVLGARDRSHAVAIALIRGLIEPKDIKW